MQTIRRFSHFVTASVRIVLRGNHAYWAWLTFLGVLIVSGALAYARQASTGLVLTAMRLGMRVRHPEFGVGTVISVEEYNDDLKITVRFNLVGVKKLLAKYAKLESA